MSEITIIVQKLLDIGWHFSMNTNDFETLIVKLIILSLKYIDKKKIWDILFPDNEDAGSHHAVDWSLVDADFNALHDVYFWLPILEVCTWKNLEKVVEKHPPIRCMKLALKKAKLDTGDYDLACRLLILHLLQKIPVLYAFEMLTCRQYRRDTHQSSAVILANLSDTLHTPAEYESALQVILHVDYLNVNTENFVAHLHALEAHRTSINTIVQQQKQTTCGRPRLRDLLERTAFDKVTMDTRLGTWESYVAFCQLHQFPNVLNDVTKQKVYFLASQCRWDWSSYVPDLIGHGGELSERITQYAVSHPDIEVLHGCIQRLNMNGRPPFPELTMFKNKCFVNFPMVQFQTMNLNQFLRLYVVIYQNESVWKTLWRMQNVLFSPQVMKDCEQFVKENAFHVKGFKGFFI